MASVIAVEHLVEIANSVSVLEAADWTIPPITLFERIHTDMVEHSPYSYMEIAYTRSTGYMAWLCSELRDNNPDRVVYTNGQGKSIEEACSNAVRNFIYRYGSSPCTS